LRYIHGQGVVHAVRNSFSDAEAHIAALANRYVASPSDHDRMMARFDAGIADRHARMDAPLESLRRPAV